ncbi:asparaginase (plasmid) [Halostagnicola larsenii XH-48]|uniref:L-asparaginase n=1 Tax=Halostagnicola larsenii XH-48 TaxID=797299 RepID=W0JX56_9EURY|nr:asparaginase [Halostagnicola larsenii]AHG01867.1 asparaginase [Halostagnicola larsenii XH-48]
MSTVYVIATGGTIVSTSSDTGTVPTESVQELVQAYPESFEHVDIELEQLTQTPSSELTINDLVRLSDCVRAVADEMDGVVVLHGTDTIEETAYYLDIVLDVDVPVVLTGAQRPYDSRSPDGPANLRGALAAASHDHVRTGAYVFFNDRLHAARPVTKDHSSNLDAYGSGNYGPVAERTPNGLWFYRRPESLSVTIPTREITATVEVMPTSTDTDGRQIDHAIDRGVDGIVVDALGLGNVPADVADSIGDAVDDDIVVVITTRCRNGVVSPMYGSKGGGAALEEEGVLFASNLPAHKARIKLLVALSQQPGDTVLEAFDSSQIDGHGYV